jgi:hypothetical protein
MNYWTDPIVPRWALTIITFGLVYSLYVGYIWGYRNALRSHKKN